MSAKKSFAITLRIFFILFSLYFLKDAFYKWDGYSYHMRFIDFLPDLSLAFILWTVPGVILAFVFWGITYGVLKTLPKPLRSISFEHIILLFILIVVPIFIKRTFFNQISIGDLIGLSRVIRLTIGAVLVVIVIWFIRRHVKRIVNGFHSRISPLFWFFTLVLVFAVPLALIKKDQSTAKSVSNTSTASSFLELKEERPNIILIVMDTLSACDMQLYGYHRATTPFISKWSKNAVVFNRAYSTANWTTPAVMSTLTGQRPWTHRVWYRAGENPVRNYENNLPKILKDYGYAVYGFVQNILAHPYTLGISDAFVKRDESSTFEVDDEWWIARIEKFFRSRPIVQSWIFRAGGNPIVRRINAYRPDRFETRVPPKMVYNSFLKYIDENPEQPFFAYLHLLPPHDPYLPPSSFIGFFGDGEKFNSENKQYYGKTLFHSEFKSESQYDVNILRKRYDEFILYSDKQFELFISRLAETIDLSNTIIILSSDHGESFSHGFLGHNGNHLYEPLVHIPLIIKVPGITDGRVIDMPVGQIDIAPTILELARIPVPDWMEGRSLLPLLKGESIKPRPVFSMQLIKNRVIGGHPITKGTIAVWQGDYKLIYYLSETRFEEENKSLLFNLRVDQQEEKNLFKKKPEIARRLMRLIDENLYQANKRIEQLDLK